MATSVYEDVHIPIINRYIDGVYTTDIHSSIIDKDVRGLHIR